MLLRVIPASLVTVFLAGCGKPSQISPPAPSPTSHAPPAAMAPSAPDQTQAAESAERSDSGAPAASPSPAPVARSDASGADLAAALAELTQALRKYSFEHRRLPRTLDEVIAAGYVKNLPAAPAGKKFAIDSKTVQVIVVKQ